MPVKFRPYSPDSREEIQQLFTQVFSQSEGRSEGLLVGNLAYDLMTGTSASDLFGFVSIEQGKIVGCIFFTRLTFSDGVNAFLLSPVAIHTDYQGQGIGQKLINFGIRQLKEVGVERVFTYGDPGFYSRVGFKQVSEKKVKAPFKLTQPEGWLGQALSGNDIEPISGDSYCVEAFNNPEIW